MRPTIAPSSLDPAGLPAPVRPAALAVLLILATGCAAPPAPACRLAVIPRLSPAESLSEAPPLLTDCPALSPAELTSRLPGAVRSLDSRAAARALALLRQGEAIWWQESEAGQRLLQEAFELLRDRPELLPAGAEERRAVHAALLLLARSLDRQEPAAAEGLLGWLARHLDDQLPSVEQLPTPLAARAAAAASAARQRQGELTAHVPAGCQEEGQLFVDGRRVAGLPVKAQLMAEGDHAFWFECGPHRSWVRHLELRGRLELPEPLMAVEAGLLLGPEGIAVVGASAGALAAQETVPERDDLAAAAPRLAAGLGVQGLFLPPSDGEAGVARLLVGSRSLAVAPTGDGYHLQVVQHLPRRSVTGQVVGWSLAGLAALLLGGGVAANLVHDDLAGQMRFGTVDRRDDLACWQGLAIGGYAGAAATAAAAATLLVLEHLSPPGPEPLW